VGRAESYGILQLQLEHIPDSLPLIYFTGFRPTNKMSKSGVACSRRFVLWYRFPLFAALTDILSQLPWRFGPVTRDKEGVLRPLMLSIRKPTTYFFALVRVEKLNRNIELKKTSYANLFSGGKKYKKALFFSKSSKAQKLMDIFLMKLRDGESQ